MKVWFQTLACWVVIAGCGAACGQTLRAGVPESLPGVAIDNGVLEFTNSNGPFNIVGCVALQSKLTFRWQAYPTARLFRMATMNELDVLYPMGYSEERDRTLQRSEPAGMTRDVWVFKGTRPGLSDKDQVRVAAKFGSPQHDYLKANGFKHLLLDHTYEGLLRLVEQGSALAAAVPEASIVDLTKNLTWSPTVETYLERQVGFYVSRAVEPKVLSRLNRAIVLCRR